MSIGSGPRYGLRRTGRRGWADYLTGVICRRIDPSEMSKGEAEMLLTKPSGRRKRIAKRPISLRGLTKEETMTAYGLPELRSTSMGETQLSRITKSTAG